MIGLDTNILVRYFAQDDPVQSRQAAQIIEHRLTENRPGFVSLVTMAETVWVLERAYGMSNLEVAAVVERMLQSDTLSVQNAQEVFTAMIALRTGQGLVLRRPYRRPRYMGRMHIHSDLRQKSDAS